MNTRLVTAVSGSTSRATLMTFPRRFSSPLTPVRIQERDIKIRRSYKYLGVHLNNELEWTPNTTALYKKRQSRLYLFRRLSSMSVWATSQDLHLDVVASGISGCVVCWGSSITAAGRHNTLVR